MPKPGMTRTEELIYESIGAGGSAIAGSLVDWLTATAKAFIAGSIPVFLLLSAFAGGALAGFLKIEGFRAQAERLADVVVVAFADSLKAALAIMWEWISTGMRSIFGGSGGASGGTNETGALLLGLVKEHLKGLLCH